MRAILLAALAAMMMLVPASAQETTPACPDGYEASPEGCSKQAWVDGCPPDMMCAMADPAGGNQTYGCEDAHCSGMADGAGEAPADTCMDGTQEDGSCDDGVVYFGPAPAEDGIEKGHEESEEDAGDGVPRRDAAGLTLLVLSMALVAAAVAFLRR